MDNANNTAPKIRLVGVIVQPQFMLDNGDSLEPVNHPPVTIPANEWSTYSSERFPAEVAEWQAHLDAEAEKAQAALVDN